MAAIAGASLNRLTVCAIGNGLGCFAGGCWMTVRLLLVVG